MLSAPISVLNGPMQPALMRGTLLLSALWLPAAVICLPLPVLIWWACVGVLAIVPASAAVLRLAAGRRPVVALSGLMLLVFLPLAELLPATWRPLHVVLVVSLYLCVAYGGTTRELLIRLGICAMVCLIAIVPYVNRLDQAWVMQGGDDEIVYSLGGLMFMGRVLATGEWPFWNPFYLIGTPFSADPIWGAHHPLNVLAASHVALAGTLSDSPDFRALTLDVYNTYRLVLGVTAVSGAYALTRSYGAARLFSLAGAATFALATDIQVYNWTSLALLPWLILALRRCIKHPRIINAALCGVLAGTVVLGGQMKMAAYIFLLAAFWATGELLSRNKSSWTEWARLACCVLVAGTFAAGIAAAQLVPLLEFAALAVRWTNDPLTGGVKIVRADAELIWAQVVMFDPAPRLLFTSAMRWVSLPLLAGFAVFVALCVSGSDRMRPLVGAALASAILGAIALGQHGGLTAVLYEHLPPWRAFRVHAQAQYPMLLIVGVGGALGLQYLVEGADHRRRRGAAGFAGVLLLAGFVSVCGWDGVRAQWTTIVQWALAALPLGWFLLWRRPTAAHAAVAVAAAVLAVSVVQGGSHATPNFPAKNDFDEDLLTDANRAVRWAQAQTHFDLGSTRTSPLWHETLLGDSSFKHGGAFHFGMEGSEGYMALALRTSIESYGLWSPEDRGIRFLIVDRATELPEQAAKRSAPVFSTNRFVVREVVAARQRIWLAKTLPKGLLPIDGDVRIVTNSAHRLVAEISNANVDGIAVVANAAGPWWRVSVNGEIVEPEEVQGFMVVRLPVGPSSVEVIFDWPTARCAIVVAASFLALVLAALLLESVCALATSRRDLKVPA